jgi:ATP-dependent RNA helicase DeaD
MYTRETGRIRSLERITKKTFERKPIPGGKEVCEKQLFHLIDKVERVDVSSDQIKELLPEISKKLDWLSKDDLIKHFVSYEFTRLLSYYKDAPDLNVEVQSRKDKMPTRKDRLYSGEDRKNMKKSRKDYARFHINLGSKNNMNATRLIGLLMDITRNRSIDVEKIDIMKGFSFFEVDKRCETDVLEAFSEKVIHSGRKVIVDMARPESAVDRYRDNESKYRGKRNSARDKRFTEKEIHDYRHNGTPNSKMKNKKSKKKQ